MKDQETFEYKTQILEHHLDTFGHVNNAKYLELYEEARWDIIERRGYGLSVIQKNKKGPVVLDVECRFKKELTNREHITIRFVANSWNGKVGKAKQEIVKEDGTIASEAVFTFGFMDMKERKLIAAPKEWLYAIGLH